MGEKWGEVGVEVAIDGEGSKVVGRDDSDDWMNVDEIGMGVCSGIDVFTTRSRTRGVTSVDSGC
jgi:hypothetical protein